MVAIVSIASVLNFCIIIVLVLVDFQFYTEIEHCKGSNYYLILYFLRILFKFVLCILTLLPHLLC